ncbi:uncharacterized protein MJAP1_002849 [Malassezia japonica]|uniref:Rho-GAP domain-containing protein n=1 Tax=Malassezia japonica TaxID=223818 RepID=A0AAF0JAW2_9BASI|nr:uncharacterized protein MJAP1_002849 [Malassezia japonica]WFD39868.1 hypothetical protein MJAP1_002849 [Malassezia japonica]
MSSNAIQRIHKLRNMRVPPRWIPGKSTQPGEVASPSISDTAPVEAQADPPRRPSSPFGGQRASFSALRRSLEKGTRSASMLSARNSNDSSSAIDASDLGKTPISLDITLSQPASAEQDEETPVDTPSTSSAQAYIPATDHTPPVLPPVETSPLQTPSFRSPETGTASLPDEPAPTTADEMHAPPAIPGSADARDAQGTEAPSIALDEGDTSAHDVLVDAPSEPLSRSEVTQEMLTTPSSFATMDTAQADVSTDTRSEAEQAPEAHADSLAPTPAKGTDAPAARLAPTPQEGAAATSDAPADAAEAKDEADISASTDVGTPAAALPTMPYTAPTIDSAAAMPWHTSPVATPPAVETTETDGAAKEAANAEAAHAEAPAESTQAEAPSEVAASEAAPAPGTSAAPAAPAEVAASSSEPPSADAPSDEALSPDSGTLPTILTPPTLETPTTPPALELPSGPTPSASATRLAPREAPELPRTSSAVELPVKPETDAPHAGMLGQIGKRGWDMVRGWRQPLPNVRKNTVPGGARLEPGKGESRRRSLFVPNLGAGPKNEVRPTSTPTKMWLDWLESSSPSLAGSGSRNKLRGLRSSTSMLTTSASMQSLRLSPRLGVPEEVGVPAAPLFGMPLRDAVLATRLLVPELSLDEEAKGVPSRAEAQQSLVPRVVTRCIQSLEKWGMDEEGIYRISGRSSHSSRLRALWDVPGADLNMAEISPADLDVHSVCSVLKMYLRELPERLIPQDLALEIDKVMSEHLPTERAPEELRSGELLLRDDAAADALVAALAPCLGRIPCAQWYLLREIAEHLGQLTQPPTVVRTKMPLSNLTLVLAPTLQVSGAVFMALVQFRSRLFTSENRPVSDPLLETGVEDSAEPAPPAAEAADSAPTSPPGDAPRALPPLSMAHGVPTLSAAGGSEGAAPALGHPIADRFAQPRSDLLTSSSDASATPP